MLCAVEVLHHICMGKRPAFHPLSSLPSSFRGRFSGRQTPPFHSHDSTPTTRNATIALTFIARMSANGIRARSQHLNPPLPSPQSPLFPPSRPPPSPPGPLHRSSANQGHSHLQPGVHVRLEKATGLLSSSPVRRSHSEPRPLVRWPKSSIATRTAYPCGIFQFFFFFGRLPPLPCEPAD